VSFDGGIIMRKKSHISLAKFLIENMKVDDLNVHKKAFYLGSILPDLKFSFLTKRHTIEETFEVLLNEIRKITIDYDFNKGINSYFARRLGVITHYLADYCTFPHNSIFTGTIKEHCIYEKQLKYSLKEYVLREDTQREREKNQEIKTIDDVIQFIENTHKEYLSVLKEIKDDIFYIVDICFKVMDAILHFVESGIAQVKALHESRTKMVRIEYQHS
jgi:hypothetical protein